LLHMMCIKYTGKIIHIIIHSSFYALHFMLPAWRPTSPKLATPHKRVSRPAQQYPLSTHVTWLITMQGQIQPQVLGTSIYKGVNLERGGRLVSTST